VPFDYYKRLTARQKREYRKSDEISTIRLPNPEWFPPSVRSLEDALVSGDHRLTQKRSQQLVSAIITALGIRPLKVVVLQKRPSANWGELQGLYEPGEPDKITVWMRTAKRKQVVAFKTFLRTLLHEVGHHLDYELLGLRETFHTEGFFKRESSLFHQLVRESKNRTDSPAEDNT
jgi:hypothetical protein